MRNKPIKWNDYSIRIVNPLFGRGIFLEIVILMGMTNHIHTRITIPLKNEWNSYSLWNGMDLQKTLYYFLFLHFVFLHFPTLQTMPIFPDLTLFLFSLSQQDRPSPSKIFVAGHRVEAPPPGFRQPHPEHPRRAQPNPLERCGRLLHRREASVHDPFCNHGRRHPRQQHLLSKLHRRQTKATSKSTGVVTPPPGHLRGPPQAQGAPRVV